MLFPDSIEDPREIFILLLTYFLDWFPYSTVEIDSDKEERKLNPRQIQHLELIDEISFALPIEYGNLSDEIISFFRSLTRDHPPNPKWSEKAINSITQYYWTFSSRHKFSLFSYIFSFEQIKESPSLSILLLLTQKEEINYPDRFGRYLTDRLSYISPQQWKILFEKDYDMTNPLHQKTALGKLAQNLIWAQENGLSIDFSPSLLQSAVLSWSIRDQRPGDELEFYLHFHQLIPLQIIQKELSLLYPPVNLIEIRKKKLREEYDRETQIHYQCLKEIENLKPSSSWEEILTMAEKSQMIELPPQLVDAIRFIWEKIINLILEMDRETTWNTIISIARAFEIKQLSTRKVVAFDELIHGIFRYILRLKDKTWPEIIHLANEAGLIELSSKKKEALEEIKTFLSTRNAEWQLPST